MALLSYFKNAWDSQIHKQTQIDLATTFGQAVFACAQNAAVQLGGAVFSASGRHGLNAEKRFWQDDARPHRFYRASVGSTIERAVYAKLIEGYSATELCKNVYQSSYASEVVFALEFTGSLEDCFPCKFNRSRPDIRLSLGAGKNGQIYEAVFDLTSQRQEGHIRNKGDNWLAKVHIPYIAEVLWTDDDIMHR